MTVTLALQGWALGALLATLGWALSLPRRDASLADRLWGLLVAAPVLWVAWRLPAALAVDHRAAWVLALLLLWAVRLTVYITWRNWGHGEDRRYAAMRQAHGASFAWRSLFTVFLLQATIAWVLGWPLLAALAAAAPMGLLDVAGIALAASGLVIETVADAQMARFRGNPAHAGQVMDRGLWRWSRHPNYFGEACVWWGLALLAWGGGAPAWLVVCPLMMTFLLLRVSGVRLLEQDIAERRPAYRDYIARTSAFVPWFPRRVAERGP